MQQLMTSKDNDDILMCFYPNVALRSYKVHVYCACVRLCGS